MRRPASLTGLATAAVVLAGVAGIAPSPIEPHAGLAPSAPGPGPRAAGAETRWPVTPSDAAGALRDLLKEHAPSPLRSGRSIRREPVVQVYAARNFAPAWGPGDDGAGRAALALEALGASVDHGLDPRDYHLADVGRPPRAWTAEREVLLTDGVLRYARDVRDGRLRSAEVESIWAISVGPRPDVAGGLVAALAADADGLRAWLAGLPPPHAGYHDLVAEGRRYRALAGRPGAPRLPPGPPIRPGASDPRVPALRARLAREADGVRHPPLDQTRLDDALAAEIRAFQARHGLVTDGVVGPATRAALDVSPTERIHQIVANLES